MLLISEEKEDLEILPEDIPLEIVYEDEELLVINKNAGLVVHPGFGNKTRNSCKCTRFSF